MKTKLLFFYILTCLFFVKNAYALDIYVNDIFTVDDVYTSVAGNNANDGLSPATPKATLAAAIAIANNGDVIYVDYGNWNEDSLVINKEIEIIGAGEERTIFDNASGVQRWATISANNVKISKLTITRYALATDGIAINITGGTGIDFNRVLIYANVGSAGQGAVLISGNSTSVTIRNSGSPCNRVSSANYGGGYKIVGSTVIFENCSINNNIVSSFNGGGVRVEGATANVTFNNTTFDDNSSQAGGAICITSGTLNLNGCCFNGNIAEGNSNIDGGGAIFIQPGGTTNVNINNCSFSNNAANNLSADGGAISMKNTSSSTCTVVINTCSFDNNSCADKGEDIYFDKAFSPTFDVTFKNNTFFTTYSGTQVNLYNQDFTASWIKFEGLSSPSGTGANGDIVANGAGIPIDKPEMTGLYTESSSNLPSTLPITRCIDRFDGNCGTATATFTCVTENKWDGTSWSKGTPTIFQHVILNADYNTQTHGNINACQMTVKSGVKLDIVDGADGTYVYVVNSIFNNGIINVFTKGNLVQVNHPLDLNDEPIVTPNINFIKNTGDKIRWDYIYWGKPVSNSVLSSFNSKFDLKYYWNPDFCIPGVDRSYEGWRPMTTDTPVGVGFITRVKTAAGLTPTNIVLNYSGLSNNGDYDALLKYYDNNHNAFKNYTLLGNPYPGAIKFEDFYNDNSDKIFGTLYLWSANTPYPGSGEYQSADFATYNLSGGVEVPGTTLQSPNGILPNGYIASAQGFMVRTKVNASVVFKNSQRTKEIPSNNQFYKIEGKLKDRFWLRLSDASGRFHDQLIGYFSEATYDFDDAYDGPMISFSGLRFFSLLDNMKMIINGRGVFNPDDSVPLGYENDNQEENMYTLRVNKKEGVFEEMNIYLFDKLLNIYFDISNESYSFMHNSSIKDRFHVVYKKPDLVTEENINSFQVYSNNNCLFVNSNNDIKSIYIYDISGKLVFQKKYQLSIKNVKENLQLPTAIYVVKSEDVLGKIKSTKIILN